MTGVPSILQTYEETTDAAKPRESSIIQVWDWQLRDWVTVPVIEALQPKPKVDRRETDLVEKEPSSVVVGIIIGLFAAFCTVCLSVGAFVVGGLLADLLGRV